MSRKRTKLFIQIYHELYDSETWKSLHWYSKLAYMRIKRNYNPKMGEGITVTYSQIRDEMTPKTFSKAIKELIEAKLVTKEQHGGLFRKKNVFKLSEQWRLEASSLMVDIQGLPLGKRQKEENSTVRYPTGSVSKVKSHPTLPYGKQTTSQRVVEIKNEATCLGGVE